VDIDMNDLSMLGEFSDFPRYTVVKSHAESQEQIRFVDCVIGVHRAVHSEHLQAQVMVARETSETHQGKCHGDAGLLGKGAQIWCSTGGDDAAAGVDDRFSALVDELQHGG